MPSRRAPRGGRAPVFSRGLEDREQSLEWRGDGGQAKRRRAAARVVAADRIEGVRVRLHRVASQRPVDVHVDKTGRGVRALDVDHFLARAGRNRLRRDLGDHALVDAQMPLAHNAVLQDEMGAGQNHARCQSGLFAYTQR